MARLSQPKDWGHMDRFRYITFSRRAWAGIIDGLVLMPIGLADRYLAAPERGTLIVLLWGTVSYSAYWLYSVLLHARYGQTLGKMVAHVEVLDVSEERIPTLRQALLRDSGYIILNCASLVYLFTLVLSGRYSLDAETGGAPAMILALANVAWFLLELGTMVTNRKRRALHDYIAGTVVVYDAEHAVAVGERAVVAYPPSRG
jgi:uncharacterized RDD family membrane protein YckC